ncbi:bacteriocin class II family protein [Clostridium cellulovorans]|uniref:COMC family protein n=1 Tax=Clostridium cellulovorans (strain ATCC 35296 / DSM 3052 / OCM 3 / 743B) TaxID=573061 RepID=D9SV21_CLOC7|nr:bacteriocin class II family protein [Clostridium cellulovorans]ADL52996.1 COMC family protein [Clostridium cellulovorans 743B]
MENFVSLTEVELQEVEGGKFKWKKFVAIVKAAVPIISAIVNPNPYSIIKAIATAPGNYKDLEKENVI